MIVTNKGRKIMSDDAVYKRILVLNSFDEHKEITANKIPVPTY